MPVIRIPAPLRPQTDGRAQVDVVGTTAGAAVADLARQYPGVADRLLDGQGRLHRFVNLFVGDEDVRELQGLATAVAEDDVLALVPAVAGGADRSGVAGRHHADTVGWVARAYRTFGHGRK